MIFQEKQKLYQFQWTTQDNKDISKDFVCWFMYLTVAIEHSALFYFIGYAYGICDTSSMVCDGIQGVLYPTKFVWQLQHASYTK